MPHPQPHHKPPSHGPYAAPGPHGPEWLVNVHDASLTREEFARNLIALGEVLVANPVVEVSEIAITVPDVVEFDLRFERTPHNSLVLLVKAEWQEFRPGGPAFTSARELVIRAPEHRHGNE